jgi:energy-coupling factor transporter ATP-binding protein EcfA2
LLLQKQEADFEATKIAREKQLRILDLKIQEKELYITERKQRLETAQMQKTQLTIPTVMEVISGALEVTANPDGLVGSPEQSEGYALWLDSFESGKVVLVLGRRGSGKTSLAAKIGEYMMATHKMPVYWIGLPEQARSLLPHWIKMVDSPDQCPVGCLIIIDEAGLHFLSLAFATDQNRLLRALLMVCRQRHSSLVVAVQSSRDLEYSVVRQADSIIFREPGMHQPDSERPDIRSMAKKAATVFKEIPQGEKRESAYVFDDDFTGIIKCTLPSFWSEDLSHVYAHFDLASMQQQVVKNQQLQKVVVQETKLLDEASLDKQILELRRQGNSIEKIARTLGCSVWRVRKCLESLRDSNR